MVTHARPECSTADQLYTVLFFMGKYVHKAVSVISLCIDIPSTLDQGKNLKRGEYLHSSYLAFLWSFLNKYA